MHVTSTETCIHSKAEGGLTDHSVDAEIRGIRKTHSFVYQGIQPYF